MCASRCSASSAWASAECFGEMTSGILCPGAEAAVGPALEMDLSSASFSRRSTRDVMVVLYTLSILLGRAFGVSAGKNSLEVPTLNFSAFVK